MLHNIQFFVHRQLLLSRRILVIAYVEYLVILELPTDIVLLYGEVQNFMLFEIYIIRFYLIAQKAMPSGSLFTFSYYFFAFILLFEMSIATPCLHTFCLIIFVLLL